MRFFYGVTSGPKVGSSELTTAGAHAHSAPDSGIRYSLDLATRESGEKVPYPANQAGLADQEPESLEPALALAATASRSEYRQPYPVTGKESHRGGGNHDYALTLSQGAQAGSQACDFMSETLPSEGWDFALSLAQKMSSKTKELRPMFPTGAGGGY